MKVGLSTACFYPDVTEHSLQLASELGFSTCELFINAECEFSPSYIKKLRIFCEAHSIAVNSLHPYTSGTENILFFSGYERRVQDGIAQYERYFQALSELGGKYFTFHGTRKVVQDTYVTAGACEFDIYRRLCDAAARYGVVFCQENVVWTKASDLSYIEQLQHHVPEISFTLDIKQARRAGVSYDDYIKVMGKRLANLHISDYNEEETCLLPGFGTVDYGALAQSLAAAGYEGDCIIEVYRANFSDTCEILRAKALLEAQMTF